ncbi:MAG: hypothetical protein AAGG46_11100, partial [Planctomycetota bacterium]
MTAFTKLVFSAVLLAAGFGLASLFGPPELADRFAATLSPPAAATGWGALEPLDSSTLADPMWAEYEALALQERTPADDTRSPLFAEFGIDGPTAGGAAPLWAQQPTQRPSPQRYTAARPDPSVTAAIAQTTAGTFAT